MALGALLVLLATGIAIYAVWTSPTGRGVVGVIGQILSLQSKALKAPGTKELRALGCQQAMVMSFEDMRKIFAVLDAGAAAKEEDPPPPFDELVICSVRIMGSAPTCETVSQTYVSAVGPRARPYLVTVSRQGKQKAECSQVRDKDGAFLHDGEDPNAYGPVTQPPPEE
jgi:hypothetical protein